MCFFRRGSLIVMAIWVLVIFTILSVGLYRTVSSPVMLVKRLREKILSRYLAKGAYLYALKDRREDDTDYETLYELRTYREKKLRGGEIIFNFIDEESKININVAPFEVISSLPGLNEEVAKKIMESSLRPFHFKEELLAVEGVNKDIFSQLEDFITVYGEGAVNINTAPKEVLEALGFDSGLVKIIIDYRAGSDGEEATEDDRVFEDAHKIISDLRSFTQLFQAQEAIILQRVSQGLLGVGGDNYTLKVDAQFLGGKGKYRVTFSGNGIEEWREL
jgi:hypothetical protein